MKTIPSQLLSHLQSEATTVCTLIKIKCVGEFQGRIFGFSSLDADITYDDGTGDGPISYTCDNGLTAEAIETAADMTVVNTDMVCYAMDSEITLSEVRQGILDFAEVTIYRINYLNLLQGHEVLGYGTCGQAKISGQKWSIEFRSIVQQLKQTFNEIWSLTCRAQFGDNRCQLPLVWYPGTITSVDVSSSGRIVTTDLQFPNAKFDLGVLKFTTGRNENSEIELDSQRGNVLTFAQPLIYNPAVGDTFQIREDCDKRFSTCKAKGNVLNFRGEHLTPVSDTGLSVPGAYITTVSG